MNYTTVGGNALLPVVAVAPLDLKVQANLLGANGALANAAVQTGTPLNTGVALNLGGAGATTATLALPGHTTGVTVNPGVNVAPVSLITAGPLLGGNAVAAPTAAATNLLTATANNIGHACLLGCR